jgi:hypothetical protein
LWSAVFLTVTAAAVGLELYAAADGNADTPTWSELIGAYVPQTIGVAAATLLAAWIVPHISAQYRSGGGAMKVKFEPVRWMTWTLAVLAALTGADAQFHVLPAGATPYLLGAGAVLTVMLGAATRSSVTPLTAPKDAAGVPLVPVTMKTTPPPDLPGIPPSAWTSEVPRDG